MSSPLVLPTSHDGSDDGDVLFDQFLAEVARAQLDDWLPEEPSLVLDLSLQCARHVGLKAVVLQACESAKSDPYHAFSGVAASLAASGVPAVIGMQYVVAANLATIFSRGMYRALARPTPVPIIRSAALRAR